VVIINIENTLFIMPLSHLDRFEAAAIKERIAFENFNKKHNIFPTTNHFIQYNDASGYDGYDVMITQHDSGVVIMRYLIEIKIRLVGERTLTKCREDGFILEMKKLNSMMKIKSLDPNLIKLLYINFTNEGTLSWWVDNINDGDVQNIPMNKKTMVNITDKANKDVCLLPYEKAKKNSYVWSDDQLLPHLNDIEKQRINDRLIEDKNMIDRLSKR